MATMIVDLDISGEKTMFSGSSEEDMAYAKTFWQSVQLMPPMESRLVSCDIKQRLKKAPPGSQREFSSHAFQSVTDSVTHPTPSSLVKV